MNRSEVWSVDLEPTIGAELRKIRPAVIVSKDSVGTLPLKVIVPITDWNPHYAASFWMVRIDPTSTNGLTKVSAADTFQVRSVSQQRFIRRLGFLTATQMQIIADALADVLDM